MIKIAVMQFNEYCMGEKFKLASGWMRIIIYERIAPTSARYHMKLSFLVINYVKKSSLM